MTLEELYKNLGGNYDQAIRVLRMDKLIDKHIRKLPQNGVIDSLIAAGESMNPEQLFETAHAVKGVCANLGLTNISEISSEISEEFRPGKERHLSDEEVKTKLEEISGLYQRMLTEIARYEESN